MAYNNPASWDSINVNDDNFLAMLQKQIASSANPSSLVLDPHRFPAPPADNPTPPQSEESSPSPPSIREKEMFMRGLDEDHNKRKAQDFDDSDDEFLGQPQHKTQHRAEPSGNKKSNRRKSTGTNPDESRLLKRKEQNRAAQRAFRERKERHVKELEDKVSALEAKSKTQDRENENLRDLLGRLQNENLLLKQSAFTFSFPGGASTSATDKSSTDKVSPAVAAPSTARTSSPKLPSPSSSSTASTPESIPEASVYSSLFAGPSDGSSSASSTNSPRSEATTSQFPSDLSSLAPDFSHIDFSNNTLDMSGGRPQYTTIASNPLYTSFQDPTLDPLATWGSFTGSEFGQDSDLNIVGVPGAKDFNPSLYGSNSATSLDEIFTQNSFVDYNTGFNNAPFIATTETSPSPVLHRAAAAAEIDHSEGCPKTREDVERIISNSTPSTFGPPVSSGVPRRDADEKDAAAHARMAALCADLPRTTKRPNQIEIGRAWEQVRQHPSFEECDIDELCNELSAKAKCDGSRPVLEESSFDDIVRALPGMRTKQQQQQMLR